MSCTFCDLYATGKVADLEDKLFWARLDIHPVSPGHLLVVPKRHVATLHELTWEEWSSLRSMREQAVGFIESLGREKMRSKYDTILDARITANSAWFTKKALRHPRLGTKPDGYNHGVNEGAAAGQTVHHLHWHVIPRYDGDMKDPSGGVRYVIPEMGNYGIARNEK